MVANTVHAGKRLSYDAIVIAIGEPGERQRIRFVRGIPQNTVVLVYDYDVEDATPTDDGLTFDEQGRPCYGYAFQADASGGPNAVSGGPWIRRTVRREPLVKMA